MAGEEGFLFERTRGSSFAVMQGRIKTIRISREIPESPWQNPAAKTKTGSGRSFFNRWKLKLT
jgi:hypothetical protein